MDPFERKPLVLLADSQLLFWSDASGARFLERLRRLIPEDDPRAAYLGASNEDAPEFFELFRAAMADVGITRCRHVTAESKINEQAFLESAELILLAGGDPLRGMESFRRHRLDRTLIERHLTGALLIGLSAGAVQLGQRWMRPGNGGGESADMLRLAPLVVDAHDEPEWARLRHAVQEGGAAFRGLGVPTGGGVLLHADNALEPVRHAATLIEWQGERLVDVLLAPGEGQAPAGETPGASEGRA